MFNSTRKYLFMTSSGQTYTLHLLKKLSALKEMSYNVAKTNELCNCDGYSLKSRYSGFVLLFEHLKYSLKQILTFKGV